jgi:hypothetical protein
MARKTNRHRQQLGVRVSGVRPRHVAAEPQLLPLELPLGPPPSLYLQADGGADSHRADADADTARSGSYVLILDLC